MLFIKDAFDRTEPYNFYLLNPEGQTICALNTIDNDSASLSAQLQDRWSLSFTVEKYIDIDNNGTFVLANGYGYLEKGMEIYVENIGYFVITEVPNVQFDGYSEVKSIKAESCEVELESKDLVNFYVNTGKTGSQEYLDEDNVVTDPISGQKLLNRYIALYDPNNPKLSLLHLILEQLPNWSVGHVDSSYIDEDGNTKWYIPYTRQEEDGTTSYFFVKGQFEEESINVYAFLTQKVPQVYRCVVTFDILNRKINIYHVSQLGEDTGIYLSNRNYQDSLVVSGATNDVYTAFNVAGADNLDIKYVNFGTIQIDNLSYVLKEPLVSSELKTKYEHFLKYRGTHWINSENDKISTEIDGVNQEVTRREYYSYLSKQWSTYKIAADEIKNRVPNDGLLTDWNTFKEDELIKQLDVYIDAVNFILLQYGYAKRNENGEPIKKEDGTYETILTGDELKAQMYKDNCWYSYSAYVDGVIPNIKIAIQNIHIVDEDEQIDPIDIWKTQWELYGVDELKVKVQTYQNTVDVLTENGYNEPYETEEGLINYYQQYQEASQNLAEAKQALEEREAEYNEQISLMEKAEQDRISLADSCKLSNKQFGFVNDDGSYNNFGQTILKLRTVTDYINENYLTTSLDDIVTTIEQEELLYKAAVEELSSQCRPQYIYSNEIENLLEDENFSANINQLVLGNFLWIEIFDDNVFGDIGHIEKLRLYNFDFNPRIPSDNFSISFTNIIKSQSKRDDEVFLLESQTHTNKNSITSSLDVSNETISAILTPELLKALTGKLSSSNSFNNMIGNKIEYIAAQPNGVLNITSSVVNVNKIVGTEAQFEQFFSKYIDADYVNSRVVISDIGQFKDLSTDIAKIKQAIIGTSSTETGIVFNLSSTNAVIDSAWVAEMVAGKISVGELAAGDITLSDKMRILSENGNLIINGNTMQFLNMNGDVGIQIGYGTSENPSIIIKDENGTSLWTSQGITKDAISDGLIVNDMLGDNIISKEKLNFPIIEANKHGGIDITQIYDGNGNKWGLQYTETIQEINQKIDDSIPYTIQISSSNGRFLNYGIVETIAYVHLYRGGEDVTADFDDSHFIWTRESADTSGDNYWNEQHATGSKTLRITRNDVLNGASFGCSFVVDGEILATNK